MFHFALSSTRAFPMSHFNLKGYEAKKIFIETVFLEKISKNNSSNKSIALKVLLKVQALPTL